MAGVGVGSSSGAAITVEHGDGAAAHFYVEAQPWAEEANCRGAGVHVFFDDIEGRLNAERIEAENKALAICALCPVRTQCAEQALVEEGNAAYGRFGIRGGMTAAQREVIYRRGGLRGRDPAQLCAGRDGRRRIPPVPLQGVAWSRHHTTLARKLCAWLAADDTPKGWKLPSVPKLCAVLGCNPVPMRHVLVELWAIGVLDKEDGFRYRGGAIDSSLPRQLRSSNPSGEGDSHA